MLVRYWWWGGGLPCLQVCCLLSSSDIVLVGIGQHSIGQHDVLVPWETVIISRLRCDGRALEEEEEEEEEERFWTRPR